MKFPLHTLFAGVGLATLLAAAGASHADTRWQRHHPWREQVNHRLMRQNARIRHERREGELTYAQARDLRAEDRGVRARERFDASHHHGHLTRQEWRQLNHQENGVSGQIGR